MGVQSCTNGAALFEGSTVGAAISGEWPQLLCNAF